MATKKSRPRKRKPRAASKPRPVEVELVVDRALRRRWQAQLTILGRSRHQGARAFDALWEAVAEIVEHDPPLYLAGGLASKKAFLAEHLGETERTASRNMRIAKYASPTEEERYGTSKIDAVLDWLEAKTGGELRGRLPVDFAKVRLHVERDGEPHRLGLDDLTVDEIEAATRELRRDRVKRPGNASPVVTAVTKHLRGKKLGKVTVRLAGGKLSLSGIPVDAFAAFVAALGKVDLPEP
jgi:hypothetical protein